MKKLTLTLFTLVLLLVLGAAGLIFYIAPDKGLNLIYEDVPVKDRALDMLKKRKLELVLNEGDVANLAKAAVAANPQVNEDVRVTGAAFELEGDRLHANLKIIWKKRVPAGLQLTYKLSWQKPNLVATVEDARIKGIGLPLSVAKDEVIPLGNELPKPIRIKTLTFVDDGVKVSFERPNLQDLRELLS